MTRRRQTTLAPSWTARSVSGGTSATACLLTTVPLPSRRRKIRNARFGAAQRVACGHWLLAEGPRDRGPCLAAGQQSHGGQFGPQSQSQDVIELTSFHAGLVARTIAECMLRHAMRGDDLDVGQADTLSPA